MKRINLNPGAQVAFVNNKARYSGYIGGVGSGKTFAGLARGLKFSQQPQKGYYGPRGLVAAINYPVLKDVVLPQFFEMVDGTGLMKRYIKSEKKAIMKGNAEILFRSLDRPNWMRGIEISWFFLDEGRHLSKEAWEILVGRLRQFGYAHAGWVCSTPNGHDWMWNLFHEESPSRWEDAVWFGAPTYQNQNHLPPKYIKDLEANYEGRFFEQEVEGKFIGALAGAVFPHWNSTLFLKDVPYDPSKPLYSFWDFGIGDLGVVLFAQIEYVEKGLPSGGTESVPRLQFVGLLEGKDRTAPEWAREFRQYIKRKFNGRQPDANFGDPAGKQRTATGTSWIDALAAAKVVVAPVKKLPFDHAVLILDNMMAGGRVLADRIECPRLAAALATHRWHQDDQGNRIGTTPIHDWTSHFCDAARYGAIALLSHWNTKRAAPGVERPGPGTMGYVTDQILREPETWLGARGEPVIDIRFPVPTPEDPNVPANLGP